MLAFFISEKVTVNLLIKRPPDARLKKCRPCTHLILISSTLNKVSYKTPHQILPGETYIFRARACCVTPSWQSNKALLFYFTQNSVSGWFGTGAQRLSFDQFSWKLQCSGTLQAFPRPPAEVSCQPSTLHCRGAASWRASPSPCLSILMFLELPHTARHPCTDLTFGQDACPPPAVSFLSCTHQDAPCPQDSGSTACSVQPSPGDGDFCATGMKTAQGVCPSPGGQTTEQVSIRARLRL